MMFQWDVIAAEPAVPEDEAANPAVDDGGRRLLHLSARGAGNMWLLVHARPKKLH